jgi:protein ImuB
MRLKSRAARSRMADLFAPPILRPPANRVPVSAAPAVPLAAPAASKLKQLWYAAVFPGLADSSPLQELQRLSMHALSFTSFVSIELPNALLLEIRGSVKLFGSLQTLHTAIDARWHTLNLKAQSATTPATLASLWLARAAMAVHSDDPKLLPGQLANVPLPCTAWEESSLQTLRAMGVRHVGEALRLPRAGLARRVTPQAVLELDIALARQSAPRRTFVPRERFRARCDFETEIEHAAYLEKAIEPLIERCALFLRERQAGVQRLKLDLRHRQLPATVLFVGLASITSERRRLMDVVVQKLNRLELKAPVRGMELSSGSLRALSADSLDAFVGLTGAAGRDTAPQLVERLRARLGEEAVYGIGLIAEHRPEAAWRRIQELSLSTAPGTPQPQALSAGMPRPVWLLQEPLPLHKPEILQGPERIESGWWDGKGVARDYYIARHAHGAKVWVFQERHTQRWYLHGVYA